MIQDEEGIPKIKEDQELDDELNNQLDQVEMEELVDEMATSNKRSLDKVEEILVDTFTMAAYGLISKKAYNG